MMSPTTIDPKRLDAMRDMIEYVWMNAGLMRTDVMEMGSARLAPAMSLGRSLAIISMFLVRRVTRNDDIEKRAGAPMPMAMRMKMTYISTEAEISFWMICWSRKSVAV